MKMAFHSQTEKLLQGSPYKICKYLQRLVLKEVFRRFMKRGASYSFREVVNVQHILIYCGDYSVLYIKHLSITVMLNLVIAPPRSGM